MITKSPHRSNTARSQKISWPLILLSALAFGAITSCSDPESGPTTPAKTPSAQDSKAGKGRWSKARSNRDAENLTDEQREEIEQLEALGYTDGVHEAPDLMGVTRHQSDKTSGQYNLFTSAHSATAQLIDMQGKVLHEWSYPFSKVWPDYPKQDQLSTFWRRNYLFENGDLLAIYEGLGIIKVDKDSNLLWASGIRAHHDMQVMPDGSIYILSREANMVPRVNKNKAVLEDFVTVLGSDGEVKKSISLLVAMEKSKYGKLWNKKTNWDGDLFHTNSIKVLDGKFAHKNPAFAEGNILVSMLLPSLVGILDPSQEKFIWVKRGPYKFQHDPRVLENGNVQIFDNQGAGKETSRVLEMDPETWKPVWEFTGSDSQPFYSETCGLAQRLLNGNTLITESDFGRAFEITSEGEMVWEFYNPFRAGDEDQYIATMMEMYRLPDGFPLDWL